MSKYNAYMVSKFSGCRLLAATYDVYRQRDVKVYMLPGEFEFVGVSDGTDAWVAPVSANPFRVNVREILGRVQAGEDPRPVVLSPTGRVVDTTPAQQELPNVRRRLGQQPPQGQRRRLDVADFSQVEARITQRRRLSA